MPIKVGDRLPQATFKRMGDSGPADVKTDEVFKGRKIVLFAVPGAFTPTCSKMHLPSYVKNHDAVKAKGYDAIACVAVNDPFVMDEWAKANGATGKVLMLADGNGEFTRAIGLEMDASKFGMGTRSKRYSMIVEDGVLKELNVEAPGEFKVSGAEATCKL